MYPLVPAVVLRGGRRDIARLDAELEPPHRQRREPASSGRAERCPVFGAYRRRHAYVIENPLQSVSDAGPRRIDDAHLDQKAAGLVRERRGVTASALSVIVSGSQRLPSYVRNQPLKSIDHSSLGACAGATTSPCAMARRRLRCG